MNRKTYTYFGSWITHEQKKKLLRLSAARQRNGQAGTLAEVIRWLIDQAEEEKR